MSTNTNETFDEVEELVDLRSVWFGLRRRAALFVGVSAAVTAAAAAYAFLSTKLYTAETSIMIEPRTQVFAYGSEVLGQASADPTMVDTEVELLRSRAMALRVNSRLHSGKTDADRMATAEKTEKKDDFFTRRLSAIAADLAALRSNKPVATPEESGIAVSTTAETSVEDSTPSQTSSDLSIAGGETDEKIASVNGAVAPGAEEGDQEGGALVGSLQPALASGEAAGAAVLAGAVDSNAVAKLMKHLEIQRVGTTFLIKIRHSDPSPVAAMEIANAYAEEYILQQLEAQYDELRQANKWIDARLATLREEVRAADAAAAKYRAEQGLVDVTGESFSEKALTGIATELAAARTNLATVRARYDTARRLSDSGAPIDSISEVMSSPIIAALRTQQVALERKLAELKVRYGDRHPEVLKTREDYSELSLQIDREKQRVVDSLQSEVNFASAQVRSLENNLRDAQGDMASNNEALVQLLELERDTDATRGVYEALLNRQKELNERDQLANANARIIARADPPVTPSKPRKKLILAGGFLLSLLIAGASAFTAEAMDNRVRNTNDLRREFGPNAPVVLVPRIQSRLLFRQRRSDDVVRRYIQEEPDSLFAESLRDLRMYLKSAQSDLSRSPVVAFTSVFRGEGATTTAFAFASLLASTGKSVAYIEYPSKATHFFKNTDSRAEIPGSNTARLTASPAPDSDNESGAGGSGSGEQGQSMADRVREIRQDVVAADQRRELYFADQKMTSVRQVCGVDMLELESADRSIADFDIPVFESMIENVRSGFDYVIVDAPSVLAKNEGGMIASAADYSVLVMEWCATSRSAARAAARRLLDMHSTILSFVVTKVDEKQRFYFRPEDRQFYFRKPS